MKMLDILVINKKLCKLFLLLSCFLFCYCSDNNGVKYDKTQNVFYGKYFLINTAIKDNLIIDGLPLNLYEKPLNIGYFWDTVAEYNSIKIKISDNGKLYDSSFKWDIDSLDNSFRLLSIIPNKLNIDSIRKEYPKGIVYLSKPYFDISKKYAVIREKYTLFDSENSRKNRIIWLKKTGESWAIVNYMTLSN